MIILTFYHLNGLSKALRIPNANYYLIKIGILASIAGISWLFDRVICEALYNLPYGFPNPQLHAFGWHLFCAWAMAETFVIVAGLSLLYDGKTKIGEYGDGVRPVSFFGVSVALDLTRLKMA